MASESNYVMVNPNRHRPEAKATRMAVIFLLLLSGLLTLTVAIGGFSALLQSFVQLWTYVMIVLFFVAAWYVFKWSRGVLAMSATLAILLGIIAIIAAPGWLSRDQSGFAEPLIPSAVLGIICVIIVPVELLLVAFAMRGFNQSSQIWVAVPEEEAHENLADKFDESGRRIQHRDEYDDDDAYDDEHDFEDSREADEERSRA